MLFKSRFTTPAVAAISFCLIGGTSPAAADILHVPGDYPSIQAAIDAAVNGDEVSGGDGQGLGGGPVDLATGPDPDADGYLRIGIDAYGSWTDTTFGGFGDTFNPVGPLPAAPATFASAFSIYRPVQGQRLLLSTIAVYQDVCGEQGTLKSKIISSDVPVDTNGDGVPDTWHGTFEIIGQDGSPSATVDRTWNLESQLQEVTPIAVVRLDLVITNTGPAWDFILQRHQDFDMVWVGDFTDDSVGTGTNRSKADRFVYQGEAGDPLTHITLSSPQGDVYYGGKGGLLPDPGDPKCVPYGFGTDVQICENFGTPGCWQNHIAGVGYDTDGDSGPAPEGCGPGGGPCDGFIGLEIPISLAVGGVVKVSVILTYGSKTPVGDPCPWDIDGTGTVGASDLLALLASWGPCKGCPADFDGSGSVGASDLLALLANWGPCP